MSAPKKDDRIIVLGSGVFGLSTSLALVKRGFNSVTVPDRYPPPVPNGNSVDIFRIIRVDYQDPVYAKMAEEAVAQYWDTCPYFRRSGLLRNAGDCAGHADMKITLLNLIRKEAEIDRIDSPATVRDMFPELDGDLQGVRGYLNKFSGWADAEACIQSYAIKCMEHGVSFITGKTGTIKKLVRGPNSKISGVETATGSIIAADFVVVAAGGWLNTILDTGGPIVTTTGHPVCMIQLTPAESARYAKMPAVTSFASAVYLLSLNERGILKAARHSYGYSMDEPLDFSFNSHGHERPFEAERTLRDEISKYYGPQISQHPFLKTRICSYSDSDDGNFILNYYPSLDNVFITSGYSGHSFKFLPVIGEYACKYMMGEISI